jgi:hypothetical protein
MFLRVRAAQQPAARGLSDIACQELRTPQSERPILVLVDHETDNEVARRNPASLLEFFGKKTIEFALLFGASRTPRNLQDNHAFCPHNTEALCLRR